MNIVQLIGALGARRYLLVFVLLAAYTRRLTASDSKFPLTLPDPWRPVVTTFVGLVYGVLATAQGGAAWGSALLGGVVSASAAGLGDMLLVATFANPANAPGWARAIAFLFDDIKGGANPTRRRGPIAPPDNKENNNGPSLRRTSALAIGLAATALIAGCAKPLPPNVPTDLATDYTYLEGDLSRWITSCASRTWRFAEGDICSAGASALVRSRCGLRDGNG